MKKNMNTEIKETDKKDDKRLYTRGWIVIGTFLGGPLGGCYLMSKNFQTLGNKESAKKTLLAGILSTLIMFGILVFIPTSVTDKIPEYVIPIVYTALISYFVTVYQGKDIQEHLKNGGRKGSGWKVIGVSILSLIISLAYFLLLFVLVPENLLAK